MSVLVPLTQGRSALVDEADYQTVAQFKWHVSNGYAARHTFEGKRRVKVYMHRQLSDARPGDEVDHRDGNKLNNTRANLRPCSHTDNARNHGPHRDNRNGYKGITLDKHTGKWIAHIAAHLGVFDTPEQAALAYNAAAVKLYGDFAWTNTIRDGGACDAAKTDDSLDAALGTVGGRTPNQTLPAARPNPGSDPNEDR